MLCDDVNLSFIMSIKNLKAKFNSLFWDRFKKLRTLTAVSAQIKVKFSELLQKIDTNLHKYIE